MCAWLDKSPLCITTKNLNNYINLTGLNDLFGFENYIQVDFALLWDVRKVGYHKRATNPEGNKKGQINM